MTYLLPIVVLTFLIAGCGIGLRNLAKSSGNPFFGDSKTVRTAAPQEKPTEDKSQRAKISSESTVQLDRF